MNKFLLSCLIFLASIIGAFSAATQAPTHQPTRSAEQILKDRTFGHKLSDSEYGGMVAGLLLSFIFTAAILYFVINAMKA